MPPKSTALVGVAPLDEDDDALDDDEDELVLEEELVELDVEELAETPPDPPVPELAELEGVVAPVAPPTPIVVAPPVVSFGVVLHATTEARPRATDGKSHFEVLIAGRTLATAIRDATGLN
jgi:hypothetical protein